MTTPQMIIETGSITWSSPPGAESISLESSTVSSTVSSDNDYSLCNPSSFAQSLNVSPTTQTFSKMKAPGVVGHRGSPFHNIECTRASFLTAVKIGVHAIELDAFKLKCGTLIVFHGGSDALRGKMIDHCGVDGFIWEYTYEEVRQFPFNPYYWEFGCGEEYILNNRHECYIPRIEDVLSDLKPSGTGIMLEIKGEGMVQDVIDMVERMEMLDQVMFSSFNLDRVRKVRQLRPQRGPDGSHTHKTAALFLADMPSDWLKQCQDMETSEIHLHMSRCTKENIKSIHDAGMGSMSWMRGPGFWTTDFKISYDDISQEDEVFYEILIATGVQKLCVNKPDLLFKVLEQIPFEE